MTLAIIALGSNINPIDNIQQAGEHLFRLPESRVVSVSSLYRTKPVGYLD
ncbi:MAG: 2-amino-4-hydroxy-6-hydroxymethyldihydropteridine diphosphokinase, partial [Neisseriaceae bacterium]|nr:2-amino-4-hydroxy-6-hydroxymethyldihydropteridine diphosphokinase [Neisseriaceae bacterium]